jgi:hypothetical protein
LAQQTAKLIAGGVIQARVDEGGVGATIVQDLE